MTAFFGKKSLCHTGNRICWVLIELCTGSADWGGFAGNPRAGGLFMLGFLIRGEEEEQQQGEIRQQTLTLELSMTLAPPQENVNHFSSNTIFVPTEQMPHWELGFLKIGAAHFSLSKTKSALHCREENLATLVRGQRPAQQLQRDTDSQEQQRALSHHVPAPWGTAHIPTARHTEYFSQQRTMQAESTLSVLGCWSRHSHTAWRRVHLLPSTAASAGNAARQNAGALQEQHPRTLLPPTHCSASLLCWEKKSHKKGIFFL